MIAPFLWVKADTLAIFLAERMAHQVSGETAWDNDNDNYYIDI
jgi:hypothetical protein